MEKNLIKIIDEYQGNNKSIAMVTITNRQGCNPRKVGKAMVVDEYGRCIGGSIGGGLIQDKACEAAVEALNKGICLNQTYDLSLDNEMHGMVFQGHVTVFIQVYKSRDRLIIVGDSKVGEQLAYYAKPLGYELYILDHREGRLLDKYPSDFTYEGDVEEILNQLDYDDKTSIVIVTHAHIYDYEALKITLDLPYRYLGMIGSRKRIKGCYERLVTEAVDMKNWPKVSTPIGLDLGGSSPAEIALSIISEIQMVKYKRSGDKLQNMQDKECT